VSKIAVIGAGYVGLTTAACFASMGHDVSLAEIDEKKVDLINSGMSPIFEKGLSELIFEGVKKGRLRAMSDNTAAVSDRDFVFICLPTPQGSDGSVDTSIVYSVIRELKECLNSGSVLVSKSTMPIGSVREIAKKIAREDIPVVSNPEFLREGSAVEDTLNCERVVIGATKAQDAEKVAQLYSSTGAEIVITDPQSAELIKYAANAFLATKVSFINSIAALCEHYEGDIGKVTHAMGLDSRIGNKFLKPGPGWGGSCFPKDTAALVHMADFAGFDFHLLKATIDSNKNHQFRIAQQVMGLLPDGLDRVVTVLGLTFKAGTNDVRDSPAIEIIKYLLLNGIKVKAYDPIAEHQPLAFGENGFERSESVLDATESSDLIVILSEWPEFGSLKPSMVFDSMRCRKIFDTRRVIAEREWIEAGFDVKIIGKK
jgi:UDPglucose 6-dehydrogenase